jgi:hypothetical protein
VVLDAAGGQGRVLALLARAADRYHLAGGVSDPVPLELVGAAWAEAGQAQTVVGQVGPATGLGERSLLRIIPAERLAQWAGSLLRPLSGEQQRLLETVLRSRTAAQAAGVLGLSRDVLRGQLRVISRALGADLDVAWVRALLLLALRAPVWEYGVPAEPVGLLDCPGWLVDVDLADRWARDLAAPLGGDLAMMLRVWLELRRRFKPAAAALGVHRSTLQRRVARAAALLEVDVDGSPVAWAEVYLALMTVRIAEPDAWPLPAGASERGNWVTRAGRR